MILNLHYSPFQPLYYHYVYIFLLMAFFLSDATNLWAKSLAKIGNILSGINRSCGEFL